MALSLIYTQIVQGPVGQTQTVQQTFTEEGISGYNNPSLAIGTNFEVLDMAFPSTGLEYFWALWTPNSGSSSLTDKINSSGSPDETLTFLAGIPWVWTATGPTANPFSNAVTAHFLTNTVAGQLIMTALFTNPS